MLERSTPRVYTSRGRVDGENWAAVAVAVNDRMAALRIGQQQLAELSGLSVSTLRLVQHGASRRVQNKTLTAIARALDWPDDHLIRILVGNRAPDIPGHASDQEILAGISRIEQQLADLSRRLVTIEELVTVGTANR
ncbi:MULTISPECIES: helix-turn-helix transcriptional regulator [Protofrankia]|uniref:Transcriptional regulator n=1 Tax=Protofrankia coriariae TaxID=1562887 RepID=A0ABR5F633_9ACTN|nr:MULTISPECIES: helix-turn-helix transcriptional regulator [Protofrankia]KLL12186.1 transcriptional regulator [Protofrankia coriariae]ONH37481.1 XRE family transcriptional regulator [Protofrankia sp. BMG5.30]